MAGVPSPPPGGYIEPYAPPPGRGAYGTYLPTQRFEPFGGLATAAAVMVQTLSRRQTARAMALATVLVAWRSA